MESRNNERISRQTFYSRTSQVSTKAVNNKK